MSLLPGRLYAVIHEEFAPAFAVTADLLLRAGAALDKVWVMDRDPARELSQPTASARAVHDAAARGAIRLFTRTPHPHHGAARLREELEFFAVTGPSLVILEGGQEFFASARDIAAWQRWAEQRGCTLLLLCSRDERNDPLDAVRAVADRLAGFARLRRDGEFLRWDTFHWFGRHEFSANRSFRVEIDADGGVGLIEIEAPGRGAGPAPDEDAVFVMAQALTDEDKPPRRWQVLPEFRSVLEHSASAGAATVILAFGPGTPVDLLARHIFDLRRAVGRRLKIVVREVGLRLRHNQEQLLLRLGANLVVPAEVGFSRLLSLVETVQGQVFSRPLPEDYAAALTDVIPLFGQGYLPPAGFAEAISQTVQRSRAVGIQNALVRLSLPAGLNVVDALCYCTMTRPGDICTADEQYLHLFLFACRESDVELTLGRVFEMPVKDLFDGETRTLAAEAILRAAEELRECAARLPDWSAEVAQGRVRAAAREKAEPIADEPRVAIAAVTRAERRPLRLRGPAARVDVA